MRIETFSHPKARDLSVPADDVLLHLPGRVTAIFDGATDSLGRKIDGVPLGRVAAQAAALCLAGLPAEAAHWPCRQILEALSTAVAKAAPLGPAEGPASTTALIAFERGDDVRLVGLGDTGFRINTATVQGTELPPDCATIPARVALFRLLLERGTAPEACETLSRHCMGLGLDRAVSDGTLSRREVDGIVQAAQAASGLHDAAAEIEDLLRGGLQRQFRFANAPDKHLGYGVLNGAPPDTGHALDQTVPTRALHSLELFSDGYAQAPDTASVPAWEAAHAALERSDPFKIAEVLAVKGSTQSAFFDDRTVAILHWQ